MKIASFILVCVCIFGCASSIKWADMTEANCEKFSFGRIEIKRILNEQDKIKLEKQGIHFHEFVFENQYFGSWKKSWNSKDLSKSPIKQLIPIAIKDKLSGSLTLENIKVMAKSPGNSMVLMQTLATVDKQELESYGKIIYNKDYFYRLEVPNSRLEDLLSYPCLRLLSIFENRYNTDETSGDKKE